MGSYAELLRQLMAVETDDCVEWPHGKNPKGYGRTNKGFVHVQVLEARVGPRPDGAVAMHSCDNPPCLNYRHLSWGTAAENSAQMVERGRSTKALVCKNGHPFLPENTLWWGARRRCKICRSEWEASR